jgi:hypothetical protein
MQAEDPDAAIDLEGFAQRVARNWHGLKSDPVLLELAMDAFQPSPERRKTRFQQALKRQTLARERDGSSYKPTQADIARLLNRTRPELNHYLAGEPKLGEEYQRRLANTLAVQVGWLHAGQVGPNGREAPIWLHPVIAHALQIVRHLARVHIAHFFTDWACIPEILTHRPQSVCIEGLPPPDPDLTGLPSLQSEPAYWFRNPWAAVVDPQLTQEEFTVVYRLLQGTERSLGELLNAQPATVDQAWRDLYPVFLKILEGEGAPQLNRLTTHHPKAQHAEAFRCFLRSLDSLAPQEPPTPPSVEG